MISQCCGRTIKTRADLDHHRSQYHNPHKPGRKFKSPEVAFWRVKGFMNGLLVKKEVFEAPTRYAAILLARQKWAGIQLSRMGAGRTAKPQEVISL